MYSAENVNAKVSIPGNEFRKQIPLYKPINLKIVIEAIQSVEKWDSYIKNYLIKKASRYPHRALRNFTDNINTHANAAYRQKMKDSKLAGIEKAKVDLASIPLNVSNNTIIKDETKENINDEKIIDFNQEEFE